MWYFSDGIDLRAVAAFSNIKFNSARGGGGGGGKVIMFTV